jgi:hypothetical protein
VIGAALPGHTVSLASQRGRSFGAVTRTKAALNAFDIT